MLFLFLGQNKSSAFGDRVQPSALAHRRLTIKLCAIWSPIPLRDAVISPWFLSNGYAVMMGALVIGDAEVIVRQRSSRRRQIKTIVWCL